VKARHGLGLGAIVVCGAFALGAITAPAPATTAAVAATPAIPATPLGSTASARSASAIAGRRAIPSVRRFTPPPIPAEDPGIADIVNGPDEPAADVVAARWDDVDRRLDELFGADLPADKRAGIRVALTTWIRDHGRAVRGYYRGSIDQTELTERVHGNMLGYAHAVEATLTREQYRTFMDLEPGEDPYLSLVPPGKTVGGPMGDGDQHGGEP